MFVLQAEQAAAALQRAISCSWIPAAQSCLPASRLLMWRRSVLCQALLDVEHTGATRAGSRSAQQLQHMLQTWKTLVIEADEAAAVARTEAQLRRNEAAACAAKCRCMCRPVVLCSAFEVSAQGHFHAPCMCTVHWACLIGCTACTLWFAGQYQGLYFLRHSTSVAFMASCLALSYRELELHLDKRTVEWEAALAQLAASSRQSLGRQRTGREATARLAALHAQRCSVLSAQLLHATQRLTSTTDASKAIEVRAEHRPTDDLPTYT